MRIRIFRAVTLADAMAQVRDEMGLDALILGTASRGGVVEVTAALEPEDEPDLPRSSRVAPDSPVSPVLAPARAADAIVVPALDALQRHNLPAGLLSAFQQGSLELVCSQLFRFARLPVDADGPPLILAGPPGGGKTLTVAKLATRLVMDGHRPLIITADGQRAGAVEQLAAFTRLLGLTLLAAGTAEMLGRVLRRREAWSPVLIDAPGLDLLDPDHAGLLASLVGAAGARVGLVLPAGLDPTEAVEVAVAHAAQGAEFLVATRLDRAGRLGGLLAAAQSCNLALTEAGTGTDVASGLAQLTPAMIAGRLAATPPLQSAVLSRTTTSPLPVPPTTDPLGVLALHIAAQGGARTASRPDNDRLPLRSTNP